MSLDEPIRVPDQVSSEDPGLPFDLPLRGIGVAMLASLLLVLAATWLTAGSLSDQANAAQIAGALAPAVTLIAVRLRAARRLR